MNGKPPRRVLHPPQEERRGLTRLVAWATLALSLSGCAVLEVPHGGSGRVRIVEGGLVETIMFESGATLNMQITREDSGEYSPLAWHVLTIGKFSPVIGSGFTRRSNIYYEATIGPYGEDAFWVGDDLYHVNWQEIDIIPAVHYPLGVFSVTVEKAAP